MISQIITCSTLIEAKPFDFRPFRVSRLGQSLQSSVEPNWNYTLELVGNGMKKRGGKFGKVTGRRAVVPVRYEKKKKSCTCTEWNWTLRGSGIHICGYVQAQIHGCGSQIHAGP